jgi:hypothetical protein
MRWNQPEHQLADKNAKGQESANHLRPPNLNEVPQSLSQKP